MVMELLMVMTVVINSDNDDSDDSDDDIKKRKETAQNYCHNKTSSGGDGDGNSGGSGSGSGSGVGGGERSVATLSQLCSVPFQSASRSSSHFFPPFQPVPSSPSMLFFPPLLAGSLKSRILTTNILVRPWSSTDIRSSIMFLCVFSLSSLLHSTCPSVPPSLLALDQSHLQGRGGGVGGGKQ
ncbi:hypothetical protein E2C01_084804 [Portunus trituberculatus]|uniref:Uncharacterized protein n=1 Tax=Portunus trituberculatus TaxID=210409 RepID=A0A5B7J5S1_PORTR|nr:hypothetical protein [Portunus trituberculatus]